MKKLPARLLQSLLPLVAICMLAPHAGAQVVTRDYRGTYLAGGPNAQIPSPKFNNGLGAASITQLLAIENQAGAVARTTNEATLDWGMLTPRLCVSPTTAVGGTSTSSIAACNAYLMGRIAYTVVRLPVVGTLGLYIAHDDDARVDLSDQIALGANYRTANWNLPVGQLNSYTSSQNDYFRIGSVVSPEQGSCLLMRVVWVNTGGRNFLRMAYRTSANGPNEYFAEDALIDPTDTASINSNCTGAVQASPTVEVRKALPTGRAQASDQFRLTLTQDGQQVQALSTSGNTLNYSMPATTVSSNPGAVVTIAETAVSGSLASYIAQARCVLGNSELSLQSLGGAGNARWQLPPLAAGQNVVCTISNNRPLSTLNLTKSSVPAQPWRSGQSVTYTLTARNTGPDRADGSRLVDPAVPGLACTSYRCSASNGAQCASNNGDASALQSPGILLPVFPVNGQVQVELSCTVAATGY